MPYQSDVERPSRVTAASAPQHLPAEVGPELGSQIHETVIGNVGPEVHEKGAASPARLRIVKVGKSRTHGASQHVVEVEGIPARVFPDHKGAADSVAGSVQNRTALAFSVIPRVFTERRSHHKIAEKFCVAMSATEAPNRSANAPPPLPYCGSVCVTCEKKVLKVPPPNVSGLAVSRRKLFHLS